MSTAQLEIAASQEPVAPATPDRRWKAGGSANVAGMESRPAGTAREHAHRPRIAGTADASGWVQRLRPGSPDREAAVAELHALLLRAARFEVQRRLGPSGGTSPAEVADLAEQSADDALMAILAKLEGFRGESRFTTWAYKFALYEAAAKCRRRSWRDREVQLEPERWPALVDPGQGVEDISETRATLAALAEAIDQDLTPHQRTVVVALILNEVPIDVLAERMGSSRGALYKTLHDARRNLRAALVARGLPLETASAERER